MEFNKKEIENYAWKTKNIMQFTIDDAINDSLLMIKKSKGNA